MFEICKININIFDTHHAHNYPYETAAKKITTADFSAI
jgi:hypothetical protein